MRSRFRAGLVTAIFGVFLCAVAVAAYALTFPELTGRIVDEAGILDPSTKAALERKLGSLRPRPQDSWS